VTADSRPLLLTVQSADCEQLYKTVQSADCRHIIYNYYYF
jgi:hypothetical protein